MRQRKAQSLLIAAMLIMVSVWPAFAQQVKMPRAKSPLLLFDFEGPDAMASWTESGMKPEISTEHVSKGSQAMRFQIPKPGGIDYPMIIGKFKDGKGFPTTDWSHYGKIAMDVWVDGDEPEDLAIELRGPSAPSGITEHFTIQPHKMNTIELSDAKSSIDSSNIDEFVFYEGPNRPREYTVTVDNIRLIPGDKLPIADFDLAYPNYRNLVFPDVKNFKVNITVQSEDYGIDPKCLAVNLSAVGGGKSVSTKVNMHSDMASISIPAKNLPAGPVLLRVVLTNTASGEELATQQWTLKKIASSDVRAMKSYIDANNNLIVDGKPFFPLGWYTDASDVNVDEIADTPFNCILSYNTNSKSKAEGLKYLDRIQQKGLKIVYAINDLYPTAKYIDSWEGIKGNDEIAKEVIKAYKDHPAIISWYTMDELPKSLLPSLKDYYSRIATEDPGHPCYIVLYNMADMKYFAAATDVLGSDPYPVPSSALTQVSSETDITVAAGKNHRAVWQVLQAFAWYQHNSSNPDRSHIPTPEELQAGRAPSYEEGRCMTYLALTHGAKGILYWCYYDMRQLPQYKEMWSWMKEIGQEVKTLSPMLLSPDDLGTVQCAQPNPGIHTKLKKFKGELYLMAVNSEKTPCTVTFDIGKKLSGETSVMFEDRSIKTSGTQLTDAFKPLEVHVYRLGKPLH